MQLHGGEVDLNHSCCYDLGAMARVIFIPGSLKKTETKNNDVHLLLKTFGSCYWTLLMGSHILDQVPFMYLSLAAPLFLVLTGMYISNTETNSPLRMLPT
jgi:hypothetical protein